MKLFAIVLGVACGITTGLFGIFFALLLPFASERSEAASSAATFALCPILALPAVAEFLERKTARRSLVGGIRTPIRDFRDFQIAWPLIAAYGLFVLIALDFVSSTAIVTVSAALASDGAELFDDEFFKRTLLLALTIQLPVMMLGAYFVARWIGARCSSRGLFTVLLTLVLLAAVISGDNELLTPVERYHPGYLRLNLIQLALTLLSGLVGYWRGRKGRWSKYLRYLFGVVPPATRDTIAELAFEEAQKAAVGARLAIGLGAPDG
jgi:hypothetical protein